MPTLARNEIAGAKPLILSVDTATNNRSIALARGDEILIARNFENKQSQGATDILVEVEAALRDSSTQLRDVDLFAVASGPGSFTGVRIGLATVKGLGATLERDCVGVPTLHAIAYAAGVSAQTFAVLPAGRGEVFAQLLRVGEDGYVQELSSASHIKPETLVKQARNILGSVKWAGGGVSIIAEAITESARGENLDAKHIDAPSALKIICVFSDSEWIFIDDKVTARLAGEVAMLAYNALIIGCIEDPSNLRAIYARPSDAELNERCQELAKN